MENVYQDVQSATSVEKLLKSDESDHKVPPNSSQDEHDPDLAQPLSPITRKRTWSYLRLARDIFLYALAFAALFMIAQKIVHAARQVHHVHHIHHTHQVHHTHQEHPGPQRHQTHQAPLTQCDCGNSTTAALSLSCKYDSMAAAWLPPLGRDDELTAEFETMGPGPDGNWIYWADSNHTQEVSLEEIAAMADDTSARFHMSYEWHVVHCIFHWRKQFRARFSGRMVEPRDDSEEHILHRGMVIRNEVWGTVAGVALNTDS